MQCSTPDAVYGLQWTDEQSVDIISNSAWKTDDFQRSQSNIATLVIFIAVACLLVCLTLIFWGRFKLVIGTASSRVNEDQE